MDPKVWNRLQKQILENNKDILRRCIYCGKLFDNGEGFAADDHGLHYETATGKCCEDCFGIVTMTNAYISKAVHANSDEEKTKHIKDAIKHLIEINELLNGGAIDVNKGVQ